MRAETALGEMNLDACGSSAPAQKLHRESTAVARSKTLFARDQELCVATDASQKGLETPEDAVSSELRR